MCPPIGHWLPWKINSKCPAIQLIPSSSSPSTLAHIRGPVQIQKARSQMVAGHSRVFADNVHSLSPWNILCITGSGCCCSCYSFSTSSSAVTWHSAFTVASVVPARHTTTLAGLYGNFIAIVGYFYYWLIIYSTGIENHYPMYMWVHEPRPRRLFNGRTSEAV